MEGGTDRFYAEAGYWHGTGRYKYNDKGDVVDVLQGLIAERGLVPHDDDWDQKRGQVKSISVARSRMYAKLYAGMYLPNGEPLVGEYGPRWLWIQYFAITSWALAFVEYVLPSRFIPDYRHKLALWAQKVTRVPRKTLYSIFRYGTDISDNYPILIGIREGAIATFPGSKFFDLHETRTGSPIPFESMTHLEVPGTRVDEMVRLLRDAAIFTPVIPLEAGEAYCRTFPFFRLVSGKPLRR
jgi:hypothetical protein